MARRSERRASVQRLTVWLLGGCDQFVQLGHDVVLGRIVRHPFAQQRLGAFALAVSMWTPSVLNKAGAWAVVLTVVLSSSFFSLTISALRAAKSALRRSTSLVSPDAATTAPVGEEGLPVHLPSTANQPAASICDFPRSKTSASIVWPGSTREGPLTVLTPRGPGRAGLGVGDFHEINPDLAWRFLRTMQVITVA